METKGRENTITRPRRANTGKVIDSLDIKFGGKKYDTQFTSTGKKRKHFMHDMHKVSVDVTFTQMTANKGINKHVERAVADIYKEYTQLEYMKVMG